MRLAIQHRRCAIQDRRFAWPGEILVLPVLRGSKQLLPALLAVPTEVQSQIARLLASCEWHLKSGHRFRESQLQMLPQDCLRLLQHENEKQKLRMLRLSEHRRRDLFASSAQHFAIAREFLLWLSRRDWDRGA